MESSPALSKHMVTTARCLAGVYRGIVLALCHTRGLNIFLIFDKLQLHFQIETDFHIFIILACELST